MASDDVSRHRPCRCVQTNLLLLHFPSKSSAKPKLKFRIFPNLIHFTIKLYATTSTKKDSIKSNVNDSLRTFACYLTLVCRVKTQENPFKLKQSCLEFSTIIKKAALNFWQIYLVFLPKHGPISKQNDNFLPCHIAFSPLTCKKICETLPLIQSSSRT